MQLTKCRDPGRARFFSGQDAQHNGTQPSYADNGDGTVTDKVTGLMWARSPDLNGDGKITVADKLSFDDASTNARKFTLAGHTDWHLPTIKEMYLLMDFRGIDPTGYNSDDLGWYRSSITNTSTLRMAIPKRVNVS